MCKWGFVIWILLLCERGCDGQRDDVGFMGQQQNNGGGGGGGFDLSNLGTQLNSMLGSLLGQGNRGANGQQQQQQQQIQNQPMQFQSPQQQQQQQQINSAPVVVQPQLQQQPQQLPTLGTNSAYDRRVAKMNSDRQRGRQRQNKNQNQNQNPNLNQSPNPNPNPNLNPNQNQNQNPNSQGPPPQEIPVQIIDQSGKLSYCNDNPADCSYLSCVAENFQKSEQANNLKMAGKVFMDKNLRHAVANDPLISQAACDKVGLDAQGCSGFRQLLGLFDNFKIGPTSAEMKRDPELHGGRRKRSKVVTDYDHVDDLVNPRSGARANVNANLGQRSGNGQGNQGNNGRGRVGPSDQGQNGQGSGGQDQANQGPRGQNQANQGPRGQGQGRSQGQDRNQGQGQGSVGSVGPVGPGGNANFNNGNNGNPNPNNGPNGNTNTRPPFPNSFTTPKPNSSNSNHKGGSVDYSAFYENGASSSKGGSGSGNGQSGRSQGQGQTEPGYQPRDCKAIVRNANRNRG